MIITLAEITAISLIILIESLLLATILGVVALLIVLLLLLLLVLVGKSSTKCLTGLERLGGRLEGRYVWAKSSLVLTLAGVHIELLLSSAREILILSGRVVFPGVEVRHGDPLVDG